MTIGDLKQFEFEILGRKRILNILKKKNIEKLYQIYDECELSRQIKKTLNHNSKSQSPHQKNWLHLESPLQKFRNSGLFQAINSFFAPKCKGISSNPFWGDKLNEWDLRVLYNTASKI